MLKIEHDDVLIVVDVQRDFCPGGALPVPQGDAVVPVLNRLIPRFPCVVFTRDWHPPDHVSFADPPEFKDGSWPRHCVRETPGAAFHPDLIVPPEAAVVSKGTEKEKEAYSGFQGTGLEEILKGAKRLFVGGLAAEFCVKATALDGLERGYEVFVVRDAVRGVDVPEGSAERALREMEERGARLILSEEIG